MKNTVWIWQKKLWLKLKLFAEIIIKFRLKRTHPCWSTNMMQRIMCSLFIRKSKKNVPFAEFFSQKDYVTCRHNTSNGCNCNWDWEWRQRSGFDHWALIETDSIYIKICKLWDCPIPDQKIQISWTSTAGTNWLSRRTTQVDFNSLKSQNWRKEL